MFMHINSFEHPDLITKREPVDRAVTLLEYYCKHDVNMILP